MRRVKVSMWGYVELADESDYPEGMSLHDAMKLDFDNDGAAFMVDQFSVEEMHVEEPA